MASRPHPGGVALPPLVVLAGRPNTGKTTLFNALTGRRQRVANFAGTTVEKAVGVMERQSSSTEIVDLPGTFSLYAATEDERVALEFLSEAARQENPLHILCLAEASSLENDLPLALVLRDCGYAVTLIVNMIDEAVLNGIKINPEILSRELGLRVILSSARTGQGLAAIEDLIARLDQNRQAAAVTVPRDLAKVSPRELKNFSFAAQRRAAGAMTAAVRRESAGDLATLSNAIALDRRLFHPVAGPLILALVLLGLFEALFTGAAPFQDALAAGFEAAGAALRPMISSPLLAGLVCDGVLGGLSAVLQFVPQIVILFLLIGFLEQSGYLPRAGVMVDRALRPFGLDGKVFIPFLSSFACAIPGVMAARTIPSEKRRLAAILLAPLMTCSARIPVYTLVIGAFIPRGLQYLGLSAQSLVLSGMYLFGVLMALVLALALKSTSLYERCPAPVTILPPYRFPLPRELLRYTLQRAWSFISRAGRVIFCLSVLLWFLGTFPRHAPAPGSTGGSAIESSYLGRLGRLVEPVFTPLGYDWRLSVAVLSSLAAREVFVGTLGTIYALEAEGSSENLGKLLLGAKTPEGAPRYTQATAVSLLLFFAIALQCLSTVAVVRRETGGWKWPLFQLSGLFLIAYSLAFAGYRITGVLIH